MLIPPIAKVRNLPLPLPRGTNSTGPRDVVLEIFSSYLKLDGEWCLGQCL